MIAEAPILRTVVIASRSLVARFSRMTPDQAPRLAGVRHGETRFRESELARLGATCKHNKATDPSLQLRLQQSPEDCGFLSSLAWLTAFIVTPQAKRGHVRQEPTCSREYGEPVPSRTTIACRVRSPHRAHQKDPGGGGVERGCREPSVVPRPAPRGGHLPLLMLGSGG